MKNAAISVSVKSVDLRLRNHPRGQPVPHSQTYPKWGSWHFTLQRLHPDSLKWRAASRSKGCVRRTSLGKKVKICTCLCNAIVWCTGNGFGIWTQTLLIPKPHSMMSRLCNWAGMASPACASVSSSIWVGSISQDCNWAYRCFCVLPKHSTMELVCPTRPCQRRHDQRKANAMCLPRRGAEESQDV